MSIMKIYKILKLQLNTSASLTILQIPTAIYFTTLDYPPYHYILPCVLLDSYQQHQPHHL